MLCFGTWGTYVKVDDCGLQTIPADLKQKEGHVCFLFTTLFGTPVHLQTCEHVQLNSMQTWYGGWVVVFDLTVVPDCGWSISDCWSPGIYMHNSLYSWEWCEKQHPRSSGSVCVKTAC